MNFTSAAGVLQPITVAKYINPKFSVYINGKVGRFGIIPRDYEDSFGEPGPDTNYSIAHANEPYTYYFFIKNKRTGQVIDARDVEERSYLITYGRKQSGFVNQIWRVTLSDALPYFFFLVQRGALAIDVAGGNTEPGTPLILRQRKISGTENQDWLLEPSDQEGYFFIASRLKKGVISFREETLKDGRKENRLVLSPKAPSNNDDQLWSFARIAENEIKP